MKTADDWIRKNDTKIEGNEFETGLWNYVTTYDSVHTMNGLIDFVKQIQVDALRQAAKIANDSEACCGEGEHIAALIQDKVNELLKS